MPDTIQILGWKAEGFRCPNHEANCCDNDGLPFKISLIQMPNGTGKTTTLILLRAALSGDANNWTPERVREIRKKNTSDKYGYFTVRLLFNSTRLLLNDQIITIIMEFDFESGRVSYKTTGTTGQELGFKPPRAFSKFMKPDFISYFVFDGELAQHLLERTHTDAVIVIERLFTFSILKNIVNKVDDFWTDSTRNATAKDEKGRTRRGKRFLQLSKTLEKLEKAEEVLQEQFIRIEDNLGKKRQQYDQELIALQGHSDLLNETNKKLEEFETNIKTLTKDVLNTMADPHALSYKFAKEIFAFKTSLDRVKLPESAAREFFEELADENECVCGRPINEEIRSTILERANRYLGSDEFSLLNSMKSVVDDAIGQDHESPEKELSEKIENLTSWIRARESTRNDLSDLQRDAEQQDPRVAEIRDEISDLENQKSNIELQLKKFQDGVDRGDTNTTDLKIMKEKAEEALNDFVEITNTLELKQKRDILNTILSSAAENAKQAIIDAICVRTNERINELMPYNNIRLETIDRCLVLEGQTGGSAGEQLSIAYAFLATLFNSSEQSLPFIVDSPAGSIDLAIRPKIADLVPRLSNQFIAFTISSEREGFVPRLSAASEDSLQYLTIFRKNTTDVEDVARASQRSSETEDGIIVEDKDFFMSFQVEKEDE